jgi:hypothetical protein
LAPRVEVSGYNLESSQGGTFRSPYLSVPILSMDLVYVVVFCSVQGESVLEYITEVIAPEVIP